MGRLVAYFLFCCCCCWPCVCVCVCVRVCVCVSYQICWLLLLMGTILIVCNWLAIHWYAPPNAVVWPFHSMMYTSALALVVAVVGIITSYTKPWGEDTPPCQVSLLEHSITAGGIVMLVLALIGLISAVEIAVHGSSVVAGTDSQSALALFLDANATLGCVSSAFYALLMFVLQRWKTFSRVSGLYSSIQTPSRGNYRPVSQNVSTQAALEL
jgi:hypothetical protein